ncbi:putative Haloacid dehalogenase-like hydrolase/HAD-hyrolase-like [Leishmania utingensis]|uniref:Haloacid dehalogenase-like hydrolase/HAD-hyrolase-like n=1 Tax=Leishmania utingensis TaxID=653362 RepID=A0AAW2ZYP4_9TRYP
MRTSSWLCQGLLHRTLPNSRRFVPPWEKDGKTADEFFGGILQSANPIQRQRKEAERQRQVEEAATVEYALPPEEQRRLEAMEAHNAAVAEERRHFLPYGATPRKYFETADMAAWGEYKIALEASTNAIASLQAPSNSNDSYSLSVQHQLMNEMEDKIPYKYDAYVKPATLRSPSSTPETPKWPLHGSVGVVMDIDGVVYRSHRLIPGADTAIQRLSTLRIPFVFMTNGGGKSEAGKAEELSALLGCHIAARQVLLSHSPMRLLVPEYGEERVLVVGSPNCASIAREYGFRRAISVQQYQCEHPEMVPLKKWGDLKRAAPGTVPFPSISAILQMSDPEDAFNDIQTVLDVLLAPGGQVGLYVSGAQTTPYFAAADDLLWATEAPLPRLGQGAFREMLASVYESITGQGMQLQQYGKPRAIAYAFAEQRLKEVSALLGWDPNQLRSIFMVGDNVESDIVGANAAGGLWTSVHVLSGIGRAPAARRTLSVGDYELEWIESCITKTPHYVAPTLDHFVRELLAFPEMALLQNKTPYHGRPNPVDLKGAYNFHE